MVEQKNGTWYYQIQVSKVKHNGVCTGCKTREEAIAYASEVKNTIKAKKTIEETAVANNQPTDPRDAIIAALKAEISRLKEVIAEMQGLNDGIPIKLSEAFTLSLEKPRRRDSTAERKKVKSRIWDDFVTWMSREYPNIDTLQKVTKSMCEAYIVNFRQNGRTDRLSDAPKSITAPSAYTVGMYMQTLAEVFTVLKADAGLSVNPFADIQKPLQKQRANREAFTLEEAKKIMSEADDFTKVLFIMAFATAMRENDICLLKWSEVDLQNDIITKYASKTGVKLQIPILDWLHDYLDKLPRKNAYVFPEHAKMYKNNRTGISYRVKTALRKMGFNTNTAFGEGKRKISTLDLHSCRHTFCTFAGMAGIPLIVVQGIVGHMSPEMTAHYSAHTTIKDRKKAMAKMPKFYHA